MVEPCLDPLGGPGGHRPPAEKIVHLNLKRINVVHFKNTFKRLDHEENTSHYTASFTVLWLINVINVSLPFLLKLLLFILCTCVDCLFVVLVCYRL